MTPDPGPWRDDAQVVPQDWGALAAYLSGQGYAWDATVAPRQFAGGLANLNYLVSVDGELAVFRRPPPGPSAEGANDLAREFRVLRALEGHFDLAPRPIHLCEDHTVVGAPFELMAYRPGTAIGHVLPPALADRPGAGEALTTSLVETMVGLHALDTAVMGLDGFGKPDGFLARQIAGWTRRADAVYDERPASVDTIVAYLTPRVPTDPVVALLHSDLKFDNLLVHTDSLRPSALIDWDMATRGDPLFDLGVLLSYWIEPGDPEALHTLEQVPSLTPGFPSRAQVVERYWAASGAEPRDLGFFVTLARLRLAIAWMQLFRVWERGGSSDPRCAGFDALARTILSWTADTLHDPPL